MKILVKLIGFILLLIFVVVVGFWLWWQKNISPKNSFSQATKIFVINKGESLKKIALNLQKEQLIHNSLAFTILVKMMGISNAIQAGDFRLSASLSAEQIAKELTHGTLDLWVTIPEGLRKEEVLEKIAAVFPINKEEFLSLTREGFLFPDTYLFPKTATAGLIIDSMNDNFYRKIKSLAPDALVSGKKINGLTLDEIVILASIIEREAKEDYDRIIVGGILLKRLENDWPLEVDATLQYILGYQTKEKTWWKKNITFEDLNLESRYNTRRKKGLPPGPICNPGISSLNAAINPQSSPYWFYISDKKGNIHYAKTLEEHNSNIRKYLEDLTH